MNLIRILFLVAIPFSALSYTEIGKFDSNDNEIKPFSYTLKEIRSINSVSVGVLSKPSTVLPYINSEALYNAELLHDSLYKKDLSNSLMYKPSLASEARFDNRKDWVEFDLDDDVRFSNNTKITAEDVDFSYRFYLKNGNSDLKKILSNVGYSKALSEKTIRFDLKKAGIETILALSTLPVLQKSSWENKSTEEIKDINYSGPYVLRNNDLKKAELEKNGYYFANPYTNAGYYNYVYININSYNSINELTNAFNNKKIDVSVNEIKPSIGIKENIKLNDTITSGMFLNTDKQVFKDKAVRENFLKILNYVHKMENASIYHDDNYSGKSLSLFSSDIKSFYNIKKIDKGAFNFTEAFNNTDEMSKRIQLNDAVNALNKKDFFSKKITVNAIIKKDDKLYETAKLLSDYAKLYGMTIKINEYDEQLFNIKKQGKEYDIIFDSVNLDPLNISDFSIFRNQIPDELFNGLSTANTFEEYLKFAKIIDKAVMFEYVFFPIYKNNQKAIIAQKSFVCPKSLNEFKFYLCRF